MLLSNEALVQTTVFVIVFSLVAVAEALAPRRNRTIERWFRWANNLAIAIVDMVLLRLSFPVAAVAFAAFVRDQGWGLLPLLGMPEMICVLVSVLLLDLTIYGQHVAFHKVPVLWRLHRMHHTDLDFDVTTGIRFHPGEILLSMVIKFAAIAVLGAPPLAVLLFEIILATASMFNHANLRLPLPLDAILRLFIVTPDMRRVYHSPSEAKRTAITASICLGGIDCSGPTARNQP